MTLMDADTESLSNHSAVEVEPQVPANTSNRVRRRHLLLHWNEQVSQVTHREVRAASNMVEHLGRRIGSVPLDPQDCAPPEVVPVERSFVLGSSQQFTILPSIGVDHGDSITDHSISTKDRYIRRKQHARDGSHCDRSSDHGETHVGSNSQNGCDGKDFKPHSQGTTSVGHRRRCSVEHVLRMRGWLCWSQFSWPWCCMWEGNQECHLEVLRQQQHHQTPFPCLRGGHSWTQWTFKRSC